MSEAVVQETVAQAKQKKKKSKGRVITEWILFGIFGALCAVVLIGNIQGATQRDAHYGQSIRFGIGSFIVLTTSMEPEIKKDDAIITYQQDVTTFKARLDKGEKIDVTFANVPIEYSLEPDSPQYKRENGGQIVITNQIMTHRLMEVHEDTSIQFGKGRYIFVASGINHQGDYSLMGQYQLFTEKQYLGVVIMNNGFLGKVFNFIISPIGLILLLLIPVVYLIVASSIDIFKALKDTDGEVAAVEGGGGAASGKLSSVSADDRERLKKELMDEMLRAKKGGKDDGK